MSVMSARGPRRDAPGLAAAAQPDSPRNARFEALLKTRAADQLRFKEQVAKHALCRDRLAMSLMQQVKDGSTLCDETLGLIRDHEGKRKQVHRALYGRWDTDVATPIQEKVLQTKAGAPRSRPSAEEDTPRKGDPLKLQLKEHRDEDGFHRFATSVLERSPRVERLVMEERQRFFARTRPTHPVEQWEVGSPRSRFEENCASDSGFISARRLGPDAHRIDESDGVTAAGKVRTRREGHNQMGLLAGTTARLGEAAQFKSCRGASCGAPCQDHYHMVRGGEAVDLELPVLGKRQFPERKYL